MAKRRKRSTSCRQRATPSGTFQLQTADQCLARCREIQAQLEAGVEPRDELNQELANCSLMYFVYRIQSVFSWLGDAHNALNQAAAEWEAIPSMCSYAYIYAHAASEIYNNRYDLVARATTIMSDMKQTPGVNWAYAFNELLNTVATDAVQRVRSACKAVKEQFAESLRSDTFDDVNSIQQSVERELWRLHPDHFDPLNEWFPDEPDRDHRHSENDNER